MKNLTAITAVLIMIFAGLACSSDDTEQANKLVDEANVFITEGNKIVQDAENKGKEFDRKVSAISNNDDHKKVSEFGDKEILPLYDKMKDNFQKAGEKFEAAAKLKLNEKFKEYLDAKASEFKKRAEYSESLKSIPKTFSSSKNEQDYQEKVAGDVEKAQKLLKEANDLSDKASKIQNENPSIFKKS